MYKKLGTFLLAGLISFLLITSSAYADRWYFGGSLGVSIADNADWTGSALSGSTVGFEYDTGFNLSGVFGYEMDMFRFEGELLSQYNASDTAAATGDINLTALMTNAYFDFPNKTRFTPFLTAGLGFAYVEADNLYIQVNNTVITGSPTDTVFAYQIGAGVAMNIKPNLIVDFKYRYLGTSDPNFSVNGTDIDAEFSSHNITLGLRYAFQL